MPDTPPHRRRGRPVAEATPDEGKRHRVVFDPSARQDSDLEWLEDVWHMDRAKLGRMGIALLTVLTRQLQALSPQEAAAILAEALDHLNQVDGGR